MLTREGLVVNHKKLFRLYLKENSPFAGADFVSAQLTDGRRILTIVY